MNPPTEPMTADIHQSNIESLNHHREQITKILDEMIRSLNYDIDIDKITALMLDHQANSWKFWNIAQDLRLRMKAHDKLHKMEGEE